MKLSVYGKSLYKMQQYSIFYFILYSLSPIKEYLSNIVYDNMQCSMELILSNYGWILVKISYSVHKKELDFNDYLNSPSQSDIRFKYCLKSTWSTEGIIKVQEITILIFCAVHLFVSYILLYSFYFGSLEKPIKIAH